VLKTTPLVERSSLRPPGPAEYPDTLIARLLVAGDRTALAEAYRRHGAVVYSLAVRITRNPTLAEDVTQEVFLRLWRDPDRFDPQRGSLRTYLLSHAHGRAVDLIRSEQARRIREDGESARIPPAVSLEEQVMELRVAEEVRSALAMLSEPERRAIELAYYGGHTYREVARILGEPEGTVKSRIRSGMRRLHERLQQAGVLSS
jgi:RNA polymerase sigma-70 factor (ECF subfamily)